MALLPIFTATASYGSPIDRKPLLRSVQFGDGYKETAPDGINNNPRVFKLTFGKRSLEEATAIIDFLEARGGHEPFLWIPHEPYDTVGVFRCEDWSFIPDEFNSNAVTATFTEAFMAQDVLPTPSLLNLTASNGTTEAGSYVPATSPAMVPLVNSASYPSDTSVYIEVQHGLEANRATFLATGNLAEGDGLLVNHDGVSPGTNSILFSPGVNTFTLVRARAFHLYYRPSFQFKAVYPRTNAALISLP